MTENPFAAPDPASVPAVPPSVPVPGYDAFSSGPATSGYGQSPVGYPSGGYGLPPLYPSAMGPDPAILALWWQRMLARVLDVLVVIGVGALVFFIGLGALFSAGGLVLFIASLIAFVGFSVMYEVTMVALRGQTLGKMALGIRVCREGGVLPGWGASFKRFGLPTALNFIPGVGGIAAFVCYLSFLWDSKSQGWHDKVASTYVIKSN